MFDWFWTKCETLGHCLKTCPKIDPFSTNMCWKSRPRMRAGAKPLCWTVRHMDSLVMSCSSKKWFDSILTSVFPLFGRNQLFQIELSKVCLSRICPPLEPPYLCIQIARSSYMILFLNFAISVVAKQDLWCGKSVVARQDLFCGKNIFL